VNSVFLEKDPGNQLNKLKKNRGLIIEPLSMFVFVGITESF